MDKNLIDLQRADVRKMLFHFGYLTKKALMKFARSVLISS